MWRIRGADAPRNPVAGRKVNPGGCVRWPFLFFGFDTPKGAVFGVTLACADPFTPVPISNSKYAASTACLEFRLVIRLSRNSALETRARRKEFPVT
jgi:hypothetical protein